MNAKDLKKSMRRSDGSRHWEERKEISNWEIIGLMIAFAVIGASIAVLIMGTLITRSLGV